MLINGFLLRRISIRRNERRFDAKFIWAYAFLFVYSLASEKFIFKMVKMNLTNSRRKKSPQLLDQSKHNYISIFALSANTFQSDQIEDGCL